MVPYPTVLRQIDLLSDEKYDTVPQQPPPSVPTKKTKAELKQKPVSTSSTGGVVPGTSSSSTSLHEVPPPPDDPIEDQNIWCEMLLLEGRKTNNKIAEGFAFWLDKNLDSTIHEVKNIYLS